MVRWQTHRLHTALGSTAAYVGSYVVGGVAVSLQHRHDIRVGIASGMLLRSLVPDVATRLALLAAVFPSYWGWSTSMVLEAICARMNEFLRAQPLARAEFLEEAWTAMSVKMANYQVVGFRGECKVDLVLRTEAKRLVGKTKGAFRLSSVLEPRESLHRDPRLRRVVARLVERQPLARVRGSGQPLAELAHLREGGGGVKAA